MRLLKNELKCTHRILELVVLESLRLDLVYSMQDLLETILQIFHALSVNFLHFLTFFSEFGTVFTCNFLHGKSRLMDQRLYSQLQILQLLLLLFRDAQAD